MFEMWKMGCSSYKNTVQQKRRTFKQFFVDKRKPTKICINDDDNDKKNINNNINSHSNYNDGRPGTTGEIKFSFNR